MRFRLGKIPRTVMLALLLTAPLPVVAAADLDTLGQGPKIGSAMAQSIGATDQSGQHRDFKSLARRRGLIILFARSFNW